MKERFIQKFQELYGKGSGIRAYFAPGRVNLIGTRIITEAMYFPAP